MVNGNIEGIRGENRPAIVVIGHGSPMEEGNVHLRNTFRTLAGLLPPDWIVRLAFIEHAHPDVRTVLGECAGTGSDLYVFPFLLFDAGHSKSDLWQDLHDLKRDFPGVKAVRDWALGTDPAPIEVLMDILPPVEPDVRDHVLFVGRGSLDPNANASLYYQGRRLWERRRGPEFSYAFVGVTEPRFKTVMESLDPDAPRGFDRLLVVPYFLFEGILMQRIRGLVGEFLSRKPPGRGALVIPPFGDHPVLLRAIARRLERLVRHRSTAMPRWVQFDSQTLSTL